jgi:hypothetical protein
MGPLIGCHVKVIHPSVFAEKMGYDLDTKASVKGRLVGYWALIRRRF